MNPVDIPRRALFRASEVCEIAQLQPYVLRTWESEFPSLGVSRTKGGPRTYRRVDVERVLQIKRLLFEEGLTLAGARRKLEEGDRPAESDEIPTLEELVTRDVRAELSELRSGLRAILELLSKDGASAASPGSAAGNGDGVAVQSQKSGRVKVRQVKPASSRRRPARA